MCGFLYHRTPFQQRLTSRFAPEYLRNRNASLSQRVMDSVRFFTIEQIQIVKRLERIVHERCARQLMA